MIIRKGNKADLENIMKMYKSCVKGMIANGIDQWDDTYPDIGTITQDLEKQSYYVKEEKEEIIGGINIDQNQDPTYLDIKWEDKSDSFLVVHRLGVKEEFWNKKRTVLKFRYRRIVRGK